MELGELQQLMAATYGERDRARGVPATVAWLTEELGELAQAVRKGSAEDQLHELGDVLAWLASLADQLGSPSTPPSPATPPAAPGVAPCRAAADGFCGRSRSDAERIRPQNG